MLLFVSVFREKQKGNSVSHGKRTAISDAVAVLPTPGVPVRSILGRRCGGMMGYEKLSGFSQSRMQPGLCTTRSFSTSIFLIFIHSSSNHAHPSSRVGVVSPHRNDMDDLGNQH
jgi:hypothetical protein